MNGMVKSIMQLGVIFMIYFGLFNLQPASADEGNIDTTFKYAWSENSGWGNFRPTNGGVTVRPTYLSGYAWLENIGWIKLGSGTGPYANTTNTNWGVNHNSSTGALSGYAWSENVGWINFNPTSSQVTIDTSTLKFDGYAWAENVGWIHFQNASPEYYVKEAAAAPTVTTQAVTGIGTTTATGNGNITSLGSPNPTQHGVCWNTAGTPTIADNKTEEGAAVATGAFTSNMTGFSPNTTYHVRAYATNTAGTAYGGQVSFTSNVPVPTITSFTPTSGSTGTTVVITGTNFTGTEVKFGGTNAASFSVDSATRITAVVGSGSTGKVTVTTGQGTGTSASTFTYNGSPATLATGNPSSYKVTVTKVEMWNGTSWATIFSGAAQLDMVAGGTFPGISNLSLPAGTYSQVRVTFNNAFPVTGMLSNPPTPYYTTATAFFGQTNLASTPTTVAGSMAAFTFYNPAWGALGVDVAQAYAITPITVGPTTDYQPTLRFTISTTLLLKGTAGNVSSYFFSLDAPTGSLVEP